MIDRQYGTLPHYYYRARFPHDYYMPPTAHLQVEIMYWEAGSGTVITHDGEVRLHKGEFILLGPHCSHGKRLSGGPCRIINIEFFLHGNNHALEIPVPTAGQYWVMRDIEQTVHGILLAIIDELATPRLKSEVMISARMAELFVTLARLHQCQQLGSAPWRIQQAQTFCAAHLDEDISMRKLAAHVGLSRAEFQRQFRKEVGMTPHAYLTQVRLERAQALLTRTDLSLQDIATAIGFQSPQPLHALFKRYLGTTPLTVRHAGITPPAHNP